MRLQLLVDAGEFMASLRSDIPSATKSILVQALTMEGDASGLEVAALIATSCAPDRRLAIDDFTTHKVSDKWVHSPWSAFDRPLRDEVRATRQMFDDLRESGAAVRFVNPFGVLWSRAAKRNHKKLVVIDDRIAYFGGINFSDHNCAWHDVMLRVEDPDIVAALIADFNATWADKPERLEREFDGISLFGLDGHNNPSSFATLFRLLDTAQAKIDVHCCYLTPPFTGRLSAAVDRGVRVRVVLPSANNWRDVNRHARCVLARAGAEVLHYSARMTHLKTMLIDDRALIVGSANFDFLSYRCQQEFMAIITDAGVVNDFRVRVLEPDVRASARAAKGSIRDAVGSLRLRLLDRVSATLFPAPAVP